MTPQDRYRDSYGSWAQAIASQREICIRRHDIKPSPDRPHEARWAVEGPCEVRNLETLKHEALV